MTVVCCDNIRTRHTCNRMGERQLVPKDPRIKMHLCKMDGWKSNEGLAYLQDCHALFPLSIAAHRRRS